MKNTNPKADDQKPANDLKGEDLKVTEKLQLPNDRAAALGGEAPLSRGFDHLRQAESLSDSHELLRDEAITQIPPPAPERRVFVEVICDGVLGPKLLRKGEVTDDPDYVKLLDDRRNLVRRV